MQLLSLSLLLTALPLQLDNLTHPCADLGMELPSMLRFEHRPEKQVGLYSITHLLRIIALHR